MTILAWHNDQKLKADAVERMRAHREADRIIQGTYISAGAPRSHGGCFHGCLTGEVLAAEIGWLEVEAMEGFDNRWWQETERLFGIPHELCSILDNAFENIRLRHEAGEWAVAVTEAIPVGADLSRVILDAIECEDVSDYGRIVDILRAAPVPESGAS